AAPFLCEGDAVEDVDVSVIPVRTDEDDLARGVAVDLTDRHPPDAKGRRNGELGDEPARLVVEHVRGTAVIAALGGGGREDHLEAPVAVEISDRDAEGPV